MRTTEEIKEMVLSYVKNDPLYKVLKDTPQEEALFSDAYLEDIIEKTGYPMADIAEWFNSSDGQLRYYLRPFYPYVFEEDGVVSGNTNNVLRLNIRQILRMRMILLLKEEYRVKGLKQLLGLDGDGFITKTSTSQGSKMGPDLEFEEMQDELEKLKQIVTGIMKTGFFRLSEDAATIEIAIDDKGIQERLQLIVEGSDKRIMLVEDLDQIERAKQDLMDKEAELEEKKKVLQRMEEKTKEDSLIVTSKLNEIGLIQTLRLKGLEKWKEENRYGMWAKLTKGDQIEIEKEKFVETFIEEHIKND